jgi:hypothetical protein
MAVADGFVDYYGFLKVDPSASHEEIARAVRDLYMKWHPDRCSDPNAHEMSCKIGEAKEWLLNPENRQKYDEYRKARSRARQEERATSGPRVEDWTRQSEEVRYRARQSASMDLEDVLAGVASVAAVGALMAVGAAAVGAEYAWKGSDRFAGRDSDGPTFGQLFWCGIGGWMCVACLAAPGFSIVTYFAFRWAFFPGDDFKFIGLANVLKGMMVSGLILLVLGGCLLGIFLNQ